MKNVLENGWLDGFMAYDLFPEFESFDLSKYLNGFENKKYLHFNYSLFKLVGEYPNILNYTGNKITLTHAHILLLYQIAIYVHKSEEYNRCAYIIGDRTLADNFGVTTKTIREWLTDLIKTGFIEELPAGPKDLIDICKHVNFARIKYVFNKKSKLTKPCDIPEDMFQFLISAYVYYNLIDPNDKENGENLLWFLKDNYKIKNEIGIKLKFSEWFKLLGAVLEIPEKKVLEAYEKLKVKTTRIEEFGID